MQTVNYRKGLGAMSVCFFIWGFQPLYWYMCTNVCGEIDTFFCTALSTLAHEQDKEKLFQLVQETGLMAYRVMELLDKANTTTFGDPEPVEVPLTIQKGPFIVISGCLLYTSPSPRDRG